MYSCEYLYISFSMQCYGHLVAAENFNLLSTYLLPGNIFFINEKIPACDMMPLIVIFHFDARLHVRKNVIVFYT